MRWIRERINPGLTQNDYEEILIQKILSKLLNEKILTFQSGDISRVKMGFRKKILVSSTKILSNFLKKLWTEIVCVHIFCNLQCESQFLKNTIWISINLLNIFSSAAIEFGNFNNINNYLKCCIILATVSIYNFAEFSKIWKF